ncbi:MAG: serine/threonine protein kinase [Planctomycetes bacterium]|nr:serine/threonine protein kinase [Planctomycetota bacterium]
MQPGQTIGDYRIERTLGVGGMGAVYLARKPAGPPVAVKVLHQADPEILARFRREAKVLDELNSPQIVRLLEFGQERGRPYLVQEYCAGGDLSEQLRKRGRFPPDEARALICDLAAALQVVHARGVVHRDLKPANVLLSEGRPKLTDFGLARAKGIDRASLTEAGVILGTPAYMAPEQFEDAREVDGRSDVYALGVILYELLAGARPFTGQGPIAVANAVLSGRVPPLPGDVPRDLCEVVARAMALDPVERYQSAEELWRALQPPEPSGSLRGRPRRVGGAPGGGGSPPARGGWTFPATRSNTSLQLHLADQDALQDALHAAKSSAFTHAEPRSEGATAIRRRSLRRPPQPRNSLPRAGRPKGPGQSGRGPGLPSLRAARPCPVRSQDHSV